MGSNILLPEQIRTTDFLASPVTSSFFNVRELEAYFRSIKRKSPQRDFHERILSVIHLFLDATERTADREGIDALIESGNLIGNPESDESALKLARKTHPDGFQLLELKEPFTFDSLKRAYRLAALKHHPDKGGTHASMIAINEVRIPVERSHRFQSNAATYSGLNAATDSGRMQPPIPA